MVSLMVALSWREQIDDRHVNAFTTVRWSFATSAGIVVIFVPESIYVSLGRHQLKNDVAF
jgi:hypothetical protein